MPLSLLIAMLAVSGSLRVLPVRHKLSAIAFALVGPSPRIQAPWPEAAEVLWTALIGWLLLLGTLRDAAAPGN